MTFFRFSKVNRAKCSRCGFYSTEGRMRVVDYKNGHCIYVCKAERACAKRLKAR